MNELYFGDNLDVLRAMASETVYLIYLDPPFNSNANYAVLYGTKRAGPSQAQAHAFEDTWKWGRAAREALNETAERHLESGALLDAFQRVFAGSDMMAYLAMMAVRLIEMRRVLKPAGSLYLHCDPTASHYLKILLDAVFGPQKFRNEIIWKRSSSHADTKQGMKRAGRIHDVLLFYTKTDEYAWNPVFTPYDESYLDGSYKFTDEDGRRYREGDLTAAKPGGDVSYDWRVKRRAGSEERWVADVSDEYLTSKPGWQYKAIPPYKGRYWAYSRENMLRMWEAGQIIHRSTGFPQFKRYLDEQPGIPLQDLWLDINPLIGGDGDRERIGYPTQKPMELLERIVRASSNEGDVVLDPFCGCGTAVEAAERLKRRWIGIDITYLAIHVIETRLVKAFGEPIKKTYEIVGRPEDEHDARVLAGRDWLEFQKWAVMALGGLPKDRPGADGGIDGIIRYHRVGIEQPNRAIISVKGGLNVGVDDVHKLKSVVAREKAEIGILVCLNPPSPAMKNEALSVGDVGPRSRRVPKIQIVTLEKLFEPNPVDLPGIIDLPEAGRSGPLRAKRRRKKIEGQTEMLFPIAGDDSSPKRKIRRTIRVVEVDVMRPERGRKSR